MYKFSISFIILSVFTFCNFPINVCAINSYSLTVHQPTYITAPNIEFVSISNNSFVQVSWQKQVSDKIEFYKVYRNSSEAELDWEYVGKMDYNSNNLLDDLNSLVNIQSYRYKISAVDKCGNEFYSNEIVKTIYLRARDSINGVKIIEWNQYEGSNISNYRIYKGLTPFDLTIIDSTSHEISKYIDIDTITTDCYYQIEAIGYEDRVEEQAETVALRRSNQIIFNSFSNVVAIKYDSVLKLFTSNNLQIYPNPIKSASAIRFPFNQSKHYQMFLIDLTGKIVLKRNLNSGEFVLKRQNLKDGIYILRISSESESIQKKIIVGTKSI